jgi:large subunit ribosomal protein L1
MSKKTIVTEKGSKKYRNNLAKVKQAQEEAKSEVLSPEKAAELLFAFEQPNMKDGPTVEVHFKLNINTTKSDQLVRASVSLPHGTGRKVRIAAFVSPENVEKAKAAGATLVGGDDLIEEIKNTGKLDFDIAIAQPDMMKKLPAIARVLGTAGVMPNPKTGTVGDNVEEMIRLIKAGKVDFKNDKTGNLHIICGKISSEFTVEKIVENLKTIMEAVEKTKPEAVKKKFVESVFVATTFSPSIRVA